MPTKLTSIPDAFWKKVDKTGSCWLWMGAKIRNYGSFGINRKRVISARSEVTDEPN